MTTEEKIIEITQDFINTTMFIDQTGLIKELIDLTSKKQSTDMLKYITNADREFFFINDIYQWILVPRWFAEKLIKYGEVVFNYYLDNYWWGRTSDYPLTLDPLVQDIACELN